MRDERISMGGVDMYTKRKNLVDTAKINPELQGRISEIIKNAHIIKDKETQEYRRISLQYGQITLDIYFMGNDVGEMVAVKHRDLKKAEAEMTTLALAGKKMIEDIAIKNKKTVGIRFSTFHPKVHQWAQTVGKDIFHWESPDYSSDTVESTYIGTIDAKNSQDEEKK